MSGLFENFQFPTIIVAKACINPSLLQMIFLSMLLLFIICLSNELKNYLTPQNLAAFCRTLYHVHEENLRLGKSPSL